MQDGSSILSNLNENINNSLDGRGTSIDDEESNDPWQFRPKAGCRYLRVCFKIIKLKLKKNKNDLIYNLIFQPIDQDQQQRILPQRSTFSSFYYMACSERGQLGKRRVRIGRGGRYINIYELFQIQKKSVLLDCSMIDILNRRIKI